MIIFIPPHDFRSNQICEQFVKGIITIITKQLLLIQSQTKKMWLGFIYLFILPIMLKTKCN